MHSYGYLSYLLDMIVILKSVCQESANISKFFHQFRLVAILKVSLWHRYC